MSDDLHAIVAFVQPFQLDPIVDAVRGIPAFPGMSVTRVQGFGSREGHPPHPGERGEVQPFHECLRLEVFCTLPTRAESSMPSAGRLAPVIRATG